MKKAEVDALQVTVQEQGDALGRFAFENSHLRTSDRKNYERMRRLENAIRRHALKQCDCTNQRACLVALAKLVPKVQRQTYKAKRQASYKK